MVAHKVELRGRGVGTVRLPQAPVGEEGRLADLGTGIPQERQISVYRLHVNGIVRGQSILGTQAQLG